MATVAQQVQQIYIGLLGRAADKAGLDYWVAEIEDPASPMTLENLRANIVNEQPEYVNGMGTLSRPQVVAQLYKNLFNHQPDAAGLEYWVNGDGKGVNVDQLVLALINGASAADQLALDNRTEVADYYTGTAGDTNYDQDSATGVLKGVTGDRDTVADAKSDVDAGNTGSGQTFTLTAGVDVLEGTSGNDTFIAATVQNNVGSFVPSLTNLDSIDGKGGVNTIKIADDSAAALALPTAITVKNIQNAEIVNAAGSVTANVSTWEGLKNVTVDQRDSAATTITTQSNVESVSVKGGTTVAVTDGNPTKDTLASVSVEKATGLTTVTSDALNTLSLTEANGGATVVAAVGTRTLDLTVNKLTGGTIADAEATGLKVTAEGANSTGLTVNTAKAATVEFAGDKTVSTNLNAAATAVITSENTAGVTITSTLQAGQTFTGGAGKDTVTVGAASKTIDMGAGDDTVNVTAALAGTGKLVGGEGTDTLQMASALANNTNLTLNDTFSKQVEGFEVLSLLQTLSGATDTVNMSNMDDISTVKSAGTAAAVVTTAAVKEVQTVTVTTGSDATGGRVVVGGVEITLAASLTTAQVAAAIAAQQAALIAANPLIESVVANGADVVVTYLNTAGDVGNITAVDNPSGVNFGAVAETDGTDEVAEIQTLTITTAPTSSGLVDIDVNGTVVQANLINGQTTAQAAATIAAAITAAAVPNVTATVLASVVTLTFTAAAGDAAQVTFADTATTGAAATAATSTPYVAPAPETQTFTIIAGTDASGGEIVVAGARIALDANQTVDQVGATIAGSIAAIQAADPNVATVNYNTATDTVTVTFVTAAGDVAPIVVADNGSGALFGATTETTKGVLFAGTAAGVLNITNFADNGTFELSGAINGASSVALKNNTSNDTFNLKLNGASNITNTAALTVAGVENINIMTTDSVTTPLDIDPTAASTVLLNAAAAKKIVVSGNHGVDFTGSVFGTDLVELDASGVQATGLTAPNLTAAQIATNKGTAGAVTFTAIQTNKDMTVKTGNGNDVITLSALVNATNAATKGATVSTGEGNDTVTGSLGKDTIDLGAGNDRVISSAGTDTITLGAGNDVYRLSSVTDSTINARDAITDFSANKVGVGANGAATTAGAVGTLADRNGDVIEISQALATKTGFGNLSLINVSVFGNAADATTFLANSGAAGNTQNAVNVALDSSTGFLYIDVSDNGTADSVIQLTGVTSIDAAAFAIVA